MYRIGGYFGALCAGLVLVAGPITAETLRCRSINGNVTCAGSGAASCQTVDGRTTCESANGAVIQSFGPGQRNGAATADPGTIHKLERLAGEDCHADDDGRD